MPGLVQFVTDFADEAVVLPVAGVVLGGLLLAGWRRGAAAWAACIAGVLGVMLVLKIVVFACGHLLPWPGLTSPSGHTAASAAVYGGLLALIAPQSRAATLVAVLTGGAVALLFALTRLALGVHTVPDVVVGAAVGVAGAIAMRRLAGARPRLLPAPWLGAAAVAVMLLFHGTRLQAEARIRWAAAEIWPLSRCRAEPGLKTRVEGGRHAGETGATNKKRRERRVTPSPFDLSGKTALITGSSRGIGRAIALLFARAGARVVIASRKLDACELVRDEIAAEHGAGRAIAVACNIGRKEELQALVDATHEAFGEIHVLVANAAINPVYGPLANCSDEAWDKVMGTNLRSTWQLCNMVLPEMVARRDGAVVVLSSIAALRGNGTIGAYGISKAAEAALVRNLAVEHGPANVRVNAIAPGIIETDFAKALTENEDIAKAVRRRVPVRRFGRPEDIAGVALLLASAAGAYVTGQVIVADGGATIADPAM